MSLRYWVHQVTAAAAATGLAVTGVGGSLIGLTATGAGATSRDAAGGGVVGLDGTGQGLPSRSGAGFGVLGFTTTGTAAPTRPGAGAGAVGITSTGAGTAVRGSAGDGFIGLTSGAAAGPATAGAGAGTVGLDSTAASARAAAAGGTGDLGLDGIHSPTEPPTPPPENPMSQLFIAVTGIGQCVADALDDSIGGPPGRVCLFTPGQIAWDNCCQPGGQLALTITRFYYSTSFPAEDGGGGRTQSGCGPPWLAAEVDVSVLRCAPTLAKDGTAPSCADLLHSGVVWDDDAEIVRNAVGCCVVDQKAAGLIMHYVLRAQVPQGPQGGCVGSVQRVVVAVRNCHCARAA